MNQYPPGCQYVLQFKEQFNVKLRSICSETMTFAVILSTGAVPGNGVLRGSPHHGHGSLFFCLLFTKHFDNKDIEGCVLSLATSSKTELTRLYMNTGQRNRDQPRTRTVKHTELYLR